MEGTEKALVQVQQGGPHLLLPVRVDTTVEPHRRTLLPERVPVPSSSLSIDSVPAMRPIQPPNPFCGSACGSCRHLHQHKNSRV